MPLKGDKQEPREVKAAPPPVYKEVKVTAEPAPPPTGGGAVAGPLPAGPVQVSGGRVGGLPFLPFGYGRIGAPMRGGRAGGGGLMHTFRPEGRVFAVPPPPGAGEMPVQDPFEQRILNLRAAVLGPADTNWRDYVAAAQAQPPPVITELTATPTEPTSSELLYTPLPDEQTFNYTTPAGESLTYARAREGTGFDPTVDFGITPQEWSDYVDLWGGLTAQQRADVNTAVEGNLTQGLYADQTTPVMGQIIRSTLEGLRGSTAAAGGGAGYSPGQRGGFGGGGGGGYEIPGVGVIAPGTAQPLPDTLSVLSQLRPPEEGSNIVDIPVAVQELLATRFPDMMLRLRQLLMRLGLQEMPNTGLYGFPTSFRLDAGTQFDPTALDELAGVEDFIARMVLAEIGVGPPDILPAVPPELLPQGV